jgi:hypothetical protein
MEMHPFLYLLNAKMCISVGLDEMMCRMDP